MTRVFTDVEKRYIRYEGCPYCESELEYGDFQLIDGEVFRDVCCTNRKCSAEFQETWGLTGVTVDCEPYPR